MFSGEPNVSRSPDSRPRRALADVCAQDLPFEKLVEELRPDRSHGGFASSSR
jgi:hypothetical protein